MAAGRARPIACLLLACALRAPAAPAVDERVEASAAPARSDAIATPPRGVWNPHPPANAPTDEALTAYERSRWVRRHRALWREHCACGEVDAAEAKRLHAHLPGVLVFDLRDVPRLGLGNTLEKYVLLLRMGVALGRAPFLWISDCAVRKGAECHFDPADYFVTAAGSPWGWSAAERTRVRRALAGRGVASREQQHEVCQGAARDQDAAKAAAASDLPLAANMSHPSVLELECPPQGVDAATDAKRAGCLNKRCSRATAAWLRSHSLRPRAGAEKEEEEEEEEEERQAAVPWLLLRVRSWEHAQLLARTTDLLLSPRKHRRAGSCAKADAHCITNSWLWPRAHVRRAIAPTLAPLERFDALVSVHVRTRFVDFVGEQQVRARRPNLAAARLAHAERPANERGGWDAVLAGRTEGWTAPDFADAFEGMLAECPELPARTRPRQPCARRKALPRVRTSRLEQLLDAPSACGDNASALEVQPVRTHAFGPLARTLTCAAHLAHALARGVAPAALAPKRRHRHASLPGPANGSHSRWGLFILSDAPLVPAFVDSAPALSGHVVHTSGAFAHNSFELVCDGIDALGAWVGCRNGGDPRGGWTRVIADLVVASFADALIGLPGSSFQNVIMSRSLTVAHRLQFSFTTEAWAAKHFLEGVVRVLQGPLLPRQANA